MGEEIWEPVEGYEEYYEVSNKGRVRSLDRVVRHRYGGDKVFPGKVAKTYIANGYPKVDLYKEGRRRKEYVHRLVARAFIPNPQHLEIVNHKDGDKSNAIVNNLEWVTNARNTKHAFEIGLRESAKREQASGAKLTEEEVDEIRTNVFPGMTYEEIGKVYGVSRYTIGDIKRYRTWV